MASDIRLQAPVGVMAFSILGKVKLRTPATSVSVIYMWRVILRLTEGVVDTDGPSHSLLTMDSREHLSRILESDGPLAHRIGDSKQVNEAELNLGQWERQYRYREAYRVTGPIFAAALSVLGTKRDRPAAKRKMHMRGYVCGERMISYVSKQ